MTYLQKIYQSDLRLLFATLCLLLIGSTFLFKGLFVTEEIYHASLGSQMSADRVQNVLQAHRNWSWIGYAVIPVAYLLKLTLIVLCLNIGTLLFNFKVSFSQLFRIALVAEAVFLLPVAVKLLWFLLVQTSFTLEEVQYFYPLSALNFFEPGSVAKWWVYPLQLANAFEVAYWLLLAYGLHRLLHTHYDRALTLVLASYLPGLLLWVTLVTFLSVSLG